MIDASLRAIVLGSLRTLNGDFGIPILYITHDLTTAYPVANAIIVLYRGKLVEAGIQYPQHPYTRLLVDPIPSPDLDTPWGNGTPLAGSVATSAPTSAAGCPFVARCPHAMPRYAEALPPLYPPNPRQAVRCVLQESAPRFADADLSQLLHLNAADTRRPSRENHEGSHADSGGAAASQLGVRQGGDRRTRTVRLGRGHTGMEDARRGWHRGGSRADPAGSGSPRRHLHRRVVRTDIILAARHDRSHRTQRHRAGLLGH
jgi:oligopeptide/dipeptide ABC transporter ATP-binding protein